MVLSLFLFIRCFDFFKYIVSEVLTPAIRINVPCTRIQMDSTRDTGFILVHVRDTLRQFELVLLLVCMLGYRSC
jgi:hypothetical protein